MYDSRFHQIVALLSQCGEEANKGEKVKGLNEMQDKDKHIRGVAAEIFVHMPFDYGDALKVLEQLRYLVEWREQGVQRAALARSEGGSGENGGNGKSEGGAGQPDRDDPFGSSPNVLSISRVRPRVSPAWR